MTSCEVGGACKTFHVSVYGGERSSSTFKVWFRYSALVQSNRSGGVVGDQAGFLVLAYDIAPPACSPIQVSCVSHAGKDWRCNPWRHSSDHIASSGALRCRTYVAVLLLHGILMQDTNAAKHKCRRLCHRRRSRRFTN